MQQQTIFDVFLKKRERPYYPTRYLCILQIYGFVENRDNPTEDR